MDCSIADESIFNCIQDIITKGLVPKSENLRNDIKRITQIIQVSKHSEKIKKLDTETFRCDIYIQNQSGFCTGLPICWALALETYINDTKGVSCRWVHKYDKLNTKFASSEILLYFYFTNCVNIVINYTQGYLMVKGAYFKKWIEEEFPKVRDVFIPVLPTDDRTCPSESLNNSTDDEIWHFLSESIHMQEPPTIEDILTHEPPTTEHIHTNEPPTTEDVHTNEPPATTGDSHTHELPNPTKKPPNSAEDIHTIEPPTTIDTHLQETSTSSSKVEEKTNAENHIPENEIELMWSKYEEIQIAVSNQDSVIQHIINKCQNMELQLNNLNHASPTKIATLEADKKTTASYSLLCLEIDKKTSQLERSLEFNRNKASRGAIPENHTTFVPNPSQSVKPRTDNPPTPHIQTTGNTNLANSDDTSPRNRLQNY